MDNDGKENPKYYWQPTHQIALEIYVTCVGTPHSATTQHHIFNTILYTPLLHMCKQALISCNVPHSDKYQDYINDLLIHLYTKVLPMVNVNTTNTFLSYGYTSCRNYIISNIIKKGNNKLIEYTDGDFGWVDGGVDADYTIKQTDVKRQILEELDSKIDKQKVLNKTNTIFLLLLRQYLLDNNFDPVGFRTYITRTMHIRNSTFIGICSRLRITTKLFREDV